jgi:hypothetical protein
MGSFVPRLLVLTVVWLLATAALTYAAAQRIGTPHVTATTTTAAAATERVLVVPDVRKQAYVFAKGTLGDAGFSWRVAGSVQGYSSNTVASQSPLAGTRVVDTGAPLVVVSLTRSGKQIGLPEAASSIHATAVKLADLSNALAPPAVTHVRVTKVKTPTKTKTTVVVTKKQKVVAPAKKLPQRRSPAFVVAGARREPLDEMPLTNRAALLLRWLQTHPKPTDANVKHWLYQHTWIVDGAQLGWWHGAAALRELVTVDQRVWQLWGIGDRSEAVARQALAEVEARSS